MLKRLNPYTRTEEEELNHNLAEWAFNSHNWIETSSGYFVCKWCDAWHTNIQGITMDYPLCKGNPILIKHLHPMITMEMKNEEVNLSIL